MKIKLNWNDQEIEVDVRCKSIWPHFTLCSLKLGAKISPLKMPADWLSNENIVRNSKEYFFLQC